MAPIDDDTTHVLYAVFRVPQPLDDTRRAAMAAELTQLLARVGSDGVTTRGVYNLVGFRADADYLIWWHAPTHTALQDAYARFRRTALGRASEAVWSAIGIHRRAEFKDGHAPAFVAGKPAPRFVTLYPYDRTNDWWLLSPEQRGQMLAEHGRMGREFPEITQNTTQTFALTDYEFLLAFEADELYRLVDMMRHLRGAQARRYTRVETPFFAGERVDVENLVARLP